MTGRQPESGPAPLAGVRVVEVASYVSGPFAGLALGDLGADVVKVEPPKGDPYRRFGPRDGDEGVMFRAVNRNKVSRVLDLKAEGGMAELAALLDGADLLVTNWRPGVAAGLGLEPDRVAERWPRLVWVRVSGFGQDGPSAAQPAFDAVIQARTGTAAALSTGAPALVPALLADKVSAMVVVQAALAALVRRSATGRGGVVDVAMLDAVAYFNAPDVAAGHQVVGEHDDRVDRLLRSTRALPTSDGAVVVSPVTGRQLKGALAAAGLGDRAERLKAASSPAELSEILYAELGPRVVQETTRHWLDAFAAADVPATEVRDIAGHLDDPQVRHNGVYRTVEAVGDGRRLRVPRYPARFDGRPPGTADLPAPPLGS